MSISQRDQAIIWHPFTQAKTAPDIISIKKAAGSYLYDENDRAYLDLISSWWVNIHGHAHPAIAKSIYDQAQSLEHVIFAGFTHEPAVTLCENLQSILPPQLNRFFFSDNGSTAVEVALKMAYQYWRNLGSHERTIFLSFEGGYHGDTCGAMAVGAASGFHDQFQELLFKILAIPYPATWEGDDEVAAKEARALATLQDHLDTYPHHIAAIILEPLIQGASGMRVCRPEFIQQVVEIIRQHDILLIFDEVMTGFGRTGTTFALNQLKIIPDFLTLSKGITGGFLPLALTITQNKIYEAFLGDEFQTAFAHGHSYTANPIACSAALCSLQLLSHHECQNNLVTINQQHQAGIQLLKAECPLGAKWRILGTIAAFEVKTSLQSMLTIKQRLLDQGILIRPLANTIYLLPPYCITPSELEFAYSKILTAINSL